MTTAGMENSLLAPFKENLQSVIYGKNECIDVMIVSLLAGGSVLIEDVPGVGKTMLAKRIPTILPDMSYEEILAVTKIYSIAGYGLSFWCIP